MSELKLKHGFSIEVLDENTSLLRPSNREAGMVTLDWKGRGYRGGLCRTGRHVQSGYHGRAWRQQLVDDATAWLEEL